MAPEAPGYVVTRTWSEWPWIYTVRHPYGGLLGIACTMWGARRIIRRSKQGARVAYREQP